MILFLYLRRISIFLFCFVLFCRLKRQTTETTNKQHNWRNSRTANDWCANTTQGNWTARNGKWVLGVFLIISSRKPTRTPLVRTKGDIVLSALDKAHQALWDLQQVSADSPSPAGLRWLRILTRFLWSGETVYLFSSRSLTSACHLSNLACYKIYCWSRNQFRMESEDSVQM